MISFYGFKIVIYQDLTLCRYSDIKNSYITITLLWNVFQNKLTDTEVNGGYNEQVGTYMLCSRSYIKKY